MNAMNPTRKTLLKGIVMGILLTSLLPLGGALAVMTLGLMPVHADTPPTAIERTLAGWALSSAIARNTGDGPSAQPLTDDQLLDGMRIYQTNCLVCHGGAERRRNDSGYTLYPPAPRFSEVGTHLTEGEAFWVARHGIRLTGMPSFGESLSEGEIRDVAGFIKRMASLPPAVGRHWNPRAYR